MLKRVFLIVILSLSVLLFASCEGKNRGSQGKWYKFSYSSYQDNQAVETTIRVHVTGSYYAQGIGDEIQFRVEYSMENLGDKPISVSYEDKFIEDSDRGLHDPFSGDAAGELQPGETAENLYVRYLLPRSALKDAGNNQLWWGRHTEDEPGLKYAIRLHPLAGQ